MHRLLFLGIVALLSGAPGPGFAQEPAAEVPDAPAPIPVAEAAAESEQLATALQQIERSARPGERVTEIAGQLGELEEVVRAEGRQLAEALRTSPSLESIAQFGRAWTARQEAVSSASALVADRVVELEELRQDLIQREQRWTAALATTQSEDAPPEALETIRSGIASITNAQQSVTRRLGELLAIQQRASALSTEIEAQHVAIDDGRANFRARLFSRNAPPIWRLEAGTDPRPLGERVRAEASRQADVFASYWTGKTAPVVQLALVFVAFLAGAQVLRRRTSNEEGSNLLASRPISASLVATLGLGPLLAGAVPRAVEHAMAFLFLLPAVRVLTHLLPRRLDGALFVLAGFYVLDRFRGILTDVPVVERVLLTAEIGLALGLLFWLLRPARAGTDDLQALPSPTTAWFLSRAALGGLAIGLVALCVGYVSLGRLLGEGTLNALYLAVFAYGAYEVVASIGSRFIRVVLGRVSRIARRHARLLERRLRATVGWSAMAVWAFVALGWFSVQDTVVAGARSALSAETEIGDLAVSLGDVLLFVGAVIVAVFGSRLIQFFLEEEVLPRFSLRRGVPHAVATMARYAGLLVGFYMALAITGFDLTRVTILAGALGVGIGFGLQNVVNNFVSGLILLFERPVSVGDTIEVGTRQGEVKRIGIRSSTIRTFTGSEVIVPNSDLISNQVENWTLSDALRRVELQVGVAYGTKPQRVLDILDEIASAHPDVLDEPAHMVSFQQFGDSSLDFELRFWVPTFETWYLVRSQLNVAIEQALEDAGIEIPFPQRDLHLRSISAEAGEQIGSADGGDADS